MQTLLCLSLQNGNQDYLGEVHKINCLIKFWASEVQCKFFLTEFLSCNAPGIVQNNVNHCIFWKECRRGSKIIYMSVQQGPLHTSSNNLPKATGAAANTRDVTVSQPLRIIRDVLLSYVAVNYPASTVLVLSIETKAPPLAYVKRHLSQAKRLSRSLLVQRCEYGLLKLKCIIHNLYLNKNLPFLIYVPRNQIQTLSTETFSQ